MGQSSVLAEEHVETTPETGQRVVGRSPWQLFWSRLTKDRVAIAGAVMILELVIVAFSAPLLAKLVGHGPNELFDHMLDEIGLPKGPNSQFWFGADQVGRDVFVRTVYAVRTSLIVAIVATGISVVIGIVLGTIAGFFGGFADTAISRTVDLVMSLPVLLFAIGLAATCGITAQGCLGGHLQWGTGVASIIGWALAAIFIGLGFVWRAQARPGAMSMIVFGAFCAIIHFPVIPLPTIQPGLSLVIFVIALVNWTYIGRIVRGQVLTLREREFVEASRALGATNSRIMFRELLPNLAAPIIVYTTLIIPSNILFEAALSFLGVGIPQSTPSLGRMLADASRGQLFTVAWWMMLYPGAFLVLLTLAFNLLGDGLRDALDPRGRRGG
jgi:peptide/nickel transport system permease protein